MGQHKRRFGKKKTDRGNNNILNEILVATYERPSTP